MTWCVVGCRFGSSPLAEHHLQGILNEVWKHKLIFVETPDANETSIALENYRRVCQWCSHGVDMLLIQLSRLAITVGGPSCYLWPGGRCQKESISTTIMDVL
jgi:hypothetical protein